MCVCKAVSVLDGGGFGVNGGKDKQQDVIQGLAMYYYLTGSL